MAKKQKKSAAQRHQKQQKKQQRRAARIQKQRSGPQLTSPENPSLDATVYDDLAPLVPRQGDGQPSPERLMEAAWNTSALAHEPEFAGVALSPFEASTLFAKTGQEYEEEHGSPEAMAEDEREEAYLEILSKTVQKLLTPEIRGQLVAGLTALRQRLRTRRQWERLATAAAAQMILEGDKTGAMSAAVGLAHELVRRSVNTGFELAESLAQLPAGADDDAPLSSEDLDEWIYRTGAGEKLAALLESDPTLQRYVERQVDQTWEEGVAALFGGDLQLEFYTPEEIVPAALIAEQVLEMEESGDGEQETTGQSQMEILYAQMTDYVQQLFTQERIDQLVHQLDGIMHEQAAELGRWSSFLTLLRDTLAAEGGVADAQGALVAALLYDVFAIPADEEEEEERTMTMLPARVLYYGKDEPLPERIPLRAGPLSLVYEGGDLRYIKLGETEILRRVYVAIRDRNWDTILPQISNLQLEVGEDEFRISYDVANVQGEIDFRWHGEISGDRNGQIRFAMDGEAHSTFIRNRIGFCVLHPMTVAGAPARIDRVDGMAQESAFPRRIAPQLVLDGVIKPMQPFDEMQALSHEITPGVWATVHFTGDIFETEDQRNWTDASFKTYSTPLRLPFPVEIQQGTKITQSVTLTLQDSSATAAQPQSTADEEETLTFRIVQPETRTPLPALGLGLASHGEPLGEEELTRLRALHLDHLRVDLTPSSPAFEETLHRAATEAQAADLSLQAALHLSDAAQAELNRLNALLARLQPPVSAWLVFDTQTKTTPAALVDLARRQLSSYQPNTPIGGGVDGYFTELNRQHPPVEHLDLVAYSFNPQVHAFDNSSLVETVAAQPETAASAHQFCGDRPLYLGPVTLRPRFNPAATGPEIAPDPDQLPPQVDVRQMSLFGAGWTLGSIKYLAESGDVASVTYYETSGWCGVMEKPAGSPLPDQFQSFADSVFPLYHVLADVGEFADGQVLAARSSQPLQVDGLVLEKAGRRRAILANLSDTPQSVRLADLGAQVRLRVLDETTAEWAMQEPEPFRATGEVLVTDAGSLTLDLNPFAVVTIDVL